MGSKNNLKQDIQDRYEEIKKTHKGRWNFILAVGLFLFIAGIVLLVLNLANPALHFAYKPIIMLLIGSILLYISFVFMHNSFFLFLGLFLVLCGILFTIVEFKITRYTLHELWPVIFISFGIALFPAGLYKLKRIKTIYMFPAIALTAMGISILLFSTHVIRTPFRMFISMWWPLLIICMGAALVIIFFVQQLRQKDFPYMKDDSLVDGDED